MTAQSNARQIADMTRKIIRPEHRYPTPATPEDERERLQAVLDYAAGRGPVHISRKHYIAPMDENGKRGLRVPSNTTLVFEGEGEIENLAHNVGRYEMLEINAVDRVYIHGPRLNGRRDLNAVIGEEYGNGIRILGACGEIRIYDPVTNNMWGDGIFVGQELFFPPYASPRDVEIWNHKADNCRRQGMSIASAHRCVVHNPVWTNTNGTLPAAGLDIEPDRDDAVLSDIQIHSPKTRANAGSGILVYLRPLRSTSTPVNILITNHDGDGDGATDGSGAQFKCAGQGGSYVTGTIRYFAPVVRRAGVSGILIEEWDARGPHLDIDRPRVIDPNERNISLPFVQAGISIAAVSGDDAIDAATIGNVTIRGPAVIDTRVTPRITRYFFVRHEGTPGAAEKIAITDPVELRGASLGTSWIDGKVKFTDALGVAGKDYAAFVDLEVSNYATAYANNGINEPVTYTLSSTYPVGAPDMVISAEGTHALTINPGASAAVLPGGGLGKRVTLAVDARVRLHRKSATAWVIVSQSGVLTFEP